MLGQSHHVRVVAERSMCVENRARLSKCGDYTRESRKGTVRLAKFHRGRASDSCRNWAMQIPKTMRVIEIKEPGESEVLVVGERPVPSIATGEVLIRVSAAGVNRADVMQRRGTYPPPPGVSDLLGLEVSGIVVAVGSAVSGWRVGDTVCALLAGGGYAEYCSVSASLCLPVPSGVDIIDAAGLPEVVLTVWTNLFDRGRLAPGETVLIHGGSSGIGTMAIQLACAFGSRVFATAGSTEKCSACEVLGAERAVNYRATDFVKAIRTVAGSGVDVILDMVGRDYLQRNMDLLNFDGRLVIIALMSGTKAEVDLTTLMRITTLGTV